MNKAPIDLPPGIRLLFLDAAETFPAVAIDTPQCRALIALQGAQVLQMTPEEGVPLLWLSPGAQFVPGRAVRGGIPLCFPWFGVHPDNPALPAHGFARNRVWQLVSAQYPAVTNRTATDGTAATVARLVFELQDDDATRAMWPHAFLARLEYSLGTELSLRFSLTNTGSDDLAFGFALHNYFPLADIAQARIEGLEGVAFFDKCNPEKALQRERSALRIAAETDRVYHEASGHYRICDEGRDVAVEVSAPDCRHAVVWNPWQEKAARLGDMPGACWRQMVCVECGNLEAGQIRVRSGETRTFHQLIAAAALRR